MYLHDEFKPKQAVAFAIVTLFLLTALAPSSSATLLAVDLFTGNLNSINPANGAATLIGPTGLNSPIGISFAPNGTLYAFTLIGNLYTINPNTGASTLVTSVGVFSTGEGDIAFSPTGTLYEVGGANGTNTDLFSINTTTGALTDIGTITTNSHDLSAAAFDSSGNLWVFDQAGSQLYRVSTATGAILATVNVNISGTGNVAGMSFNPANGTLYVGTGLGTNGLYTLNTTTGNLFPIGPSGINISGMAFTPVATPEPDTFGIVLAGAFAIAFRRRVRLGPSSVRA
jgi:outer membrane protein assembly factor BamB